ncbi:gas vesicle protein K [Nocardiopsis changdeensis]|uniref:Gas vesicle protein K n=1 Tax=Nocardiopsis changdeensis TaxID=2831969 RepID=A0ABX8BR18_9ACTN|nr:MULTISPECIES: gas vesicle protein K [Nocardiopsis]QUX23188.1 gas vesicle protein K [Nocardiopsis changdeensis]QYX39131.1 gas vesicle protein K [Nocardiopsis sp. MT53]
MSETDGRPPGTTARADPDEAREAGANGVDGVLAPLRDVLDATAERREEGAGAHSGSARQRLRHRIETEPDTVERDLIKLVLTVVELVRQLMERQALRRVDQGDLTEDQEERIGMTLMLLEERMTELRDRYGLTAADLNLDLGPLGSLLPRDPEG